MLALFLLVTYLAFIIGLAIAGQLQTVPQTLLFGGGNSFDSGPMLNQILGRSAMFSLGICVTIFGIGTLLCFSAGQFVSLAIRSRILAAVATLFVCAPLVAWLYLMWLGGVPIWWSVLPIVAAFLVAGWMSLRAVLSEKSIVSRVVVPSVLVLVTAVTVFYGATRFRATQIPTVAFEFKRVDHSDPAIISQIQKKFNSAVAMVSRPEGLPDSIGGYYGALLKTNREYKPGFDVPPQRVPWDNENGFVWPVPDSKDEFMLYTLDSGRQFRLELRPFLD